MTANATSPSYSGEIPNLGTADEYVNGAPDRETSAADISILGITVIDGTTQLKDGNTIKGARVCSIAAGASAALAGLRSEKVAVATALTASFFVAGMLSRTIKDVRLINI
jgi:hypothetical protein